MMAGMEKLCKTTKHKFLLLACRRDFYSFLFQVKNKAIKGVNKGIENKIVIITECVFKCEKILCGEIPVRIEIQKVFNVSTCFAINGIPFFDALFLTGFTWTDIL